ncbi:MAG: ABC transporter ATP-binding protein [Bryobacterales bacterium]|nr:ABC transporter ATP-binding protein [Bryobacterales bacterium]
MSAPSPAGLAVRELGVRLGSRQVLSAVSFDVNPGEHVVIMGPSGAGKSTLLRAIAGLIAPVAGSIQWEGASWSSGHDLRVPPERRGIGMIAQDLALWPHLTVREHALTTLRWRGFALDERAAEAERLLAWVGLAGLAESRPSQLSGGEAQRLALVRAIAVVR